MKPKFSLRDLFWLVLVSSIVTAWGLDHILLSRRIERLEGEWHDNGYVGSISGRDIIDSCFQDSTENAESP